MYNTCTIPKEENEGIVSYALTKLGYRLVSPPGIERVRDECDLGIEYESVTREHLHHLLRFYPDDGDGSGYFIAFKI